MMKFHWIMHGEMIAGADASGPRVDGWLKIFWWIASIRLDRNSIQHIYINMESIMNSVLGWLGATGTAQMRDRMNMEMQKPKID